MFAQSAPFVQVFSCQSFTSKCNVSKKDTHLQQQCKLSALYCPQYTGLLCVSVAHSFRSHPKLSASWAELRIQNKGNWLRLKSSGMLHCINCLTTVSEERNVSIFTVKDSFIIIYLSWSWATCWHVPVSRIQKSLQRSTMIPSASWGVVFHYPG